MQSDRWGKWVVAAAGIVIVVAGIAMLSSISSRKAMLTIGSQLVHARVADTDDARHKGLSGTSSLADTDAMLFVFDNPGRWGIWMKDMSYNIDIVWLNESKKIIHIERDVSPETYPRVFLPSSDALYVVELSSGFASMHGLGIGQVVSFSVR